MDQNAKNMQFKSWPFYSDWSIIFCNDRETGEKGIDMEENLHKLPKSSVW